MENQLGAPKASNPFNPVLYLANTSKGRVSEMKLVLTGNPGTGKTSVAKELARHGFEYISANEIAICGRACTDCKKIAGKKRYSVDLKKLQKMIAEKIKESKSECIVEGHLLCEIKLPCDYCVVLRCSPEVLRKRLMKKEKSWKLIEENIIAEMLDYSTQLSEQNYPKQKVCELDTSKLTAKQVAKEIIKFISNKKSKITLNGISWQKELEAYLTPL